MEQCKINHHRRAWCVVKVISTLLIYIFIADVTKRGKNFEREKQFKRQLESFDAHQNKQQIIKLR